MMLELMAKANLIIDFDSTILAVELIETLFELATANLDASDKQTLLDKVMGITNAGMNGEINFSESLKTRLSLLELDQKLIDSALRYLRDKISNSFINNLPELQKHNLLVISGGFKELIIPLLEPLGISKQQVFANTLLFENGRMIGADLSNPLAHSLGKVKTVQRLGLSGTTIVIGDGYSDYEIREKGLADYFLYYSEYIHRDKVAELADTIVVNFDEAVHFLNEYV